uniref:Tyrosine-protein kinase n=1 Tax=Parascaris univalens TaxID=6257 RepID=A0A915AP31_PARUN
MIDDSVLKRIIIIEVHIIIKISPGKYIYCGNIQKNNRNSVISKLLIRTTVNFIFLSTTIAINFFFTNSKICKLSAIWLAEIVSYRNMAKLRSQILVYQNLSMKSPQKQKYCVHKIVYLSGGWHPKR